MSEFQEKFKIDIALFDSTGSTAEQISRYFDMKGYRRADFIISGVVQPTSANSTYQQTFTARLLTATDATGGGATGISSATAVVGKISTGTIIGSTDKANEILLNFGQHEVGATVSIIGTKFTGATGASAAYYFADVGASAASTVASEGFIAAFNATNNTLSSVWEATSVVGADATVGIVRIYAKDQNNTAYITATGTTVISPGIDKVCGHIGIDTQHLKDGQRYIAVGLYTRVSNKPFTVTCIREKLDGPVTQKTVHYSKTMNGSTSK